MPVQFLSINVFVRFPLMVPINGISLLWLPHFLHWLNNLPQPQNQILRVSLILENRCKLTSLSGFKSYFGWCDSLTVVNPLSQQMGSTCKRLPPHLIFFSPSSLSLLPSVGSSEWREEPCAIAVLTDYRLRRAWGHCWCRPHRGGARNHRRVWLRT